MKFVEFMDKLKTDPRQIFVLTGEEFFFIDQAKKKILERIFPNEDDLENGLTRVDDMKPADLIVSAETVPFFSERIAIMLEHTTIFKDSDSKDKSIDQLAKLFQRLPPTTFLIFVSDSKLDKRKKIFKAVEKSAMILEADPIRPWEIEPWLNSRIRELNLSFDKDALEYFLTATSGMDPVSLNFLNGELEKLTLFVEKNRVTKQNLVEMFSSLPEVSNFALNEAISEKNISKAIFLLRRQIKDGNFLPLIVGLLTRHVRQILQAKLLIKSGVTGRNLAKPLELNPFIAEKLGNVAKKFSEENLKSSLLILYDADYLLKTGGAGAEILEEVIIKLCRK